MDDLNYGRLISTATSAFCVMIANGRQCRSVMGAVPERQDPYRRESPGIRDFDSWRFHKKTVDPKLYIDLLNFS